MTITDIYQLFLKHGRITTDSRDCTAGSIFLALKGKSFNGNAFAAQALQQGCSYAIIDEPSRATEGDNRYIAVDDCLATLQRLANLHRQTLGTTVVAITGTNGKTTTKELVAAVLSTKYNVLYTEGNLNNHIGVPKTLLRLTEKHNIAVIEMGANHPGEIKALAEIAAPNHALITNVGRAHLEGFGSFEGVKRTKGELYDYIKASRSDGSIFLNSGDKDLNAMADERNLPNRIYYGTASNGKNSVTGSVTACSPFLNFKWQASHNGAYAQPYHSCDNAFHEVSTHVIGSYNIYNMLAAAAVGHFFGVDDKDISAALANYVPQNNRSQMTVTKSNTLIIDAYNANPTSMAAAIDNFRDVKAADKMVILGEMGELGAVSADEHRKIIERLRHSGFTDIWLVGDKFKTFANNISTTDAGETAGKDGKSKTSANGVSTAGIDETAGKDRLTAADATARSAFRFFDNVEDVKSAIETCMPKSKWILIKGSHSTRLYELPALL